MSFTPLQPVEEYRVTIRQLERAAARDIGAIMTDRQAGQPKPWKLVDKSDMDSPAHCFCN